MSVNARALQTKEAAIDELEAYKEQIEQGVVSFADLAAKVSDCSSAKVRHCFSIVASRDDGVIRRASFSALVVLLRRRRRRRRGLRSRD